MIVYGKSISLNGPIDAGDNNVTFNIGNISAGILDLNALVNTTGDFVVNGGEFGNIFNVEVIGQTASFNGGAQPSTLNGPDETKTWTITGINKGSVGDISFKEMGFLVGKTGDDTFFIDGEYYLSGGIDGGEAGVGVLKGPNAINTWTVTANNQGTLFSTGSTGETPFVNISELRGSQQKDTFIFNGVFHISDGEGGGIIDGGEGAEELNLISTKGISTDNTWRIKGENTGTLQMTGDTLISNFQNIGTIGGGRGNDTIVFEEGAAVTGAILGDSLAEIGIGHNILDYTENSVDPNISWIDAKTGTAENIGAGFFKIQEVLPYLERETSEDHRGLCPEECRKINRAGTEDLYLNTISTIVSFDVSQEFFMVSPFPQYFSSYTRISTNSVIDMSQSLNKEYFKKKNARYR